MLEIIKKTADFLIEKIDFQPEIGIILGTGLGGLVKEIDVTQSISYEDIPNFPVSTVEGHSGKLIFGELGNKKVIAMQNCAQNHFDCLLGNSVAFWTHFRI